MNLVQINERLKDLPSQVIQQYANGMNPEVPPYLALAEMQRRETAQKQMATAQGAAQGPQPSIKEQMEQKAGLMAAQELQQQQAMQQMQQPQGPMPVPAGIPQPQMQPQAPQGMMAGGGLARAPVNFNFQHGGIVAFAGGGTAHPQAALIEFLKTMGLTPEEFTRAPTQVQNQIRDMMRSTAVEAPAPAPAAAPAAQAAQTAGRGYNLGKGLASIARGAGPLALADLALRAGEGATSGVANAAASSRENREALMATQDPDLALGAAILEQNAREQEAKTPLVTSQGFGDKVVPRYPQAAAKPPAPIADIKAFADQQRRQQAPRPAQTPPPVAAAQPRPETPQDEVARLALEAMRKPTQAMTPEEAMAKEGKMAAGYGLDKPFGGEERGLLEAMKQRQAQYAAGRPMAELGATLRGFGQGYGGASAAGERASQETYASDMAHQREMLNAINALNKANLDTSKERYKTSGALFGKDQESAAAANRERAQSLGQMRGQDIQAGTQQRGQDIQLQVGKMQAAATREAREQGLGMKEIKAAEDAYARDPEAQIIRDRLKSPLYATNPAKAAPDIQRLREIQASKYKQFGATLEGAPGAASPGGTRPPLSSFQR